jgi:hypothetical protein
MPADLKIEGRGSTLDPRPSDKPGARTYTVLCLGALLVMVLSLGEYGLGWWGLVPVLAGSVAVLLHWSIGPPLLLLTLGGLLLASARGLPPWARAQPSPLAVLALCVAVLTYVAGQYRLQGLTLRIFPPDPRRPGQPAYGRAAPQRRGPALPNPWEAGLLVLTAPLYAAAAYLVWGRVKAEAPALNIDPREWQAVLVVWIVGLGLAGAAAVVGYLGQTQARPEEVLLYLQDQVWRGTRGEQGRLNRWLVWARRRRQRRKETG